MKIKDTCPEEALVFLIFTFFCTSSIALNWRNEDVHILLALKDADLVTALRGNLGLVGAVYRPTATMTWFLLYKIFGDTALAFQIINGILWGAVGVALFRLGQMISGTLIGPALGIIALLSIHIEHLHFIYNLFLGTFYTYELLFVTLFLLFLIEYNHSQRRLVLLAAGLMALGAFLSHSMSCLLLPILYSASECAHGRFNPRKPRAWMMSAGFAVAGLIAFSLVQYQTPFPPLSRMLTKAVITQGIYFSGLKFAILPWLLILGISAEASGRPGSRLVLPFLVLSGVLLVLSKGILSVAVSLALLAYVKKERYLILVAWALYGILVFLITPEPGGHYFRHFLIPFSLLAGIAMTRPLEWGARWVGGRLSGRERSGVPTAQRFPAGDRKPVLFLLAIFLIGQYGTWGLHFITRVPLLQSKYKRLDYMRDMGNAFNYKLLPAIANIVPEGGSVFFWKVYKERKEEREKIYTESYYTKLQPCKYAFYRAFLHYHGRSDVRVGSVEWLIDNWETRRHSAGYAAGTNPHECSALESVLDVERVWEYRSQNSPFYCRLYRFPQERTSDGLESGLVF